MGAGLATLQAAIEASKRPPRIWRKQFANSPTAYFTDAKEICEATRSLSLTCSGRFVAGRSSRCPDQSQRDRDRN
jgi:hypothetical protein